MKTPWHLWVLGVVMLVCFALGDFDYTMSHLRSPWYLAMIPEPMRSDMLAYLDIYPAWATAAWAVGVWFAVLGAVLLLARSRLCVPALMLALLGFIANSTYTYLIAPKTPALTGTRSMLFSAVILVSLLLCIAYVRRLNFKGILR